ncbi:hypothetical protein [Methanothermobacter wolfeii]|uniref:hypothetical protein n=1 Tax=Methanothermobacter wolfeii TaxID=145261 RepID=UPI0024B376A7|nr:hypothetical protein [Methanothermobacter wolfeii]MDI6701941.1 hypothetical protein [Methanothermobacter wolfeii]MDI6841386.1 hypothetical protein [Methanothermobacter wolfeii]
MTLNWMNLVVAGAITLILTPLTARIISIFRESNLYTDVRGGTPRGAGLAPFTALTLFTPAPFNIPLAIMGVLAFMDDLSGRRRIGSLPLEWGQVSRGAGIIAVTALTYPVMGPSGFLVAMMVQPLNIADMQPGAACTSTMILSLLAIMVSIITGSDPYMPLLVLTVCAAYSPMDYAGRIMMGEVGNHSLAVALGISFYLAGGPLTLLSFFIISPLVIAAVRGEKLSSFLEEKLGIENPTPGDLYMDVLTGGGLGDLARKIILRNRSFSVDNRFLIALGFRRLLYNPFAG